jgi:hypothetical protein
VNRDGQQFFIRNKGGEKNALYTSPVQSVDGAIEDTRHAIVPGAHAPGEERNADRTPTTLVMRFPCMDHK